MAASELSTKVGIKATAVEYDKETDEYEIDLANVYIIALDVRTKVIRIKIKSDQIHQHNALLGAKNANNGMSNNKIGIEDVKTKLVSNDTQLQEIWDSVDVKTNENEQVPVSESNNVQIQNNEAEKETTPAPKNDDEIKEMEDNNAENKAEPIKEDVEETTSSFNILQ